MAAAAQGSSLLCSCRSRPCTTRATLSPFAPYPFFSPLTPIRASSKQLKLSNSRSGRVVSAVVSEESAIQSSFSGTDGFKLTYLEGNSWLWDEGGVKILVDPILVGNLDFGIPGLYDAAKKFLKNFQLSDIPEVDCLLITQSLDDHCHFCRLKQLPAIVSSMDMNKQTEKSEWNLENVV